MTAADYHETVDFLEQLRPGGPWVLTAIIPDGTTETITAQNANEIRSFVRACDGRKNVYYSPNPTRTAMTRKAKKTDIAAIEFLLADLDPKDGESPDDAKARYLAAIDAHKPAPTAIVDSGNGIQGLWKLAERIVLPDPASPQWTEVVTDVEPRAEALMARLGAVAGTQNIDRILRLPGTTNLPNAAKAKAGRVACPTKLIRFNGAACALDDFPAPEPLPEQGDGGQDDDDKLERFIRDGAPKGQRSERVWWVINEMLRRGYPPAAIGKVLLERRNGISAHIYDQSRPREYAERQISEAISKIDFSRDKNGAPYPTLGNVCVGLLKLGVQVTYDKFADRMIIAGLDDFGPALDDPAVLRLWFLFDWRFRFRPQKTLLFDVIKDTARLNGFHPVRDYLDGLVWDGVKRIDRWLITYAGAEDSEYTRAVGTLLLVAAVRRVRRPGVKFDEMVVFESPEQGTNKSSGLATIAIREEWFSDDLPLTADSKRVIESLRGRWIVEAAELSGMKHADVEHLKAFLSRVEDRARMSYDRINTEYPRQCVVIGTTNSGQYLRDTTGNRRYWPVRIKQFDLVELKKDRDQLWAEAAAREAQGESIRLAPNLWAAAAEEQTHREVGDPYFDALQNELGDKTGKIAAASIWVILDMKEGMRGQIHNQRMGEAMRKLGWRRPNAGGLIKIDGRNVSGYVKGEQPWKTIKAERSYDKDRGTHQLSVFTEQAAGAEPDMGPEPPPHERGPWS